MSTVGNDSPWPSTADGYELEKKIGRGAFSSVSKAYCDEKRQHVAIKILDLEKSHTFEDIAQEVNIMKLCSHPNVVHCYASFLFRDQLWLVMEYMDKGSCFHVLDAAKRHGRKPGMNEEWVAYILKETIKGLQYFHQNGQIHRDIKAGNILLSSDASVKLADFGVSGSLIVYGLRRDAVKSFVGTPCWMAPEVMEQREGYDQKADVWSLGITALELAKGYAPYAKLDPMQVLLKTIQEDPPALRTYKDDRQPNGEPFSRHFKEFVRLCLQKDPKNRPTCTTLLNHSFFKKRDVRPQSLLSELLNVIPCVSEVGVERSKPFGKIPQLKQREDGTARESEETKDELQGDIMLKEHPPGTTWVFEEEGSIQFKQEGPENMDQESVQMALFPFPTVTFSLPSCSMERSRTSSMSTRGWGSLTTASSLNWVDAF